MEDIAAAPKGTDSATPGAQTTTASLTPKSSNRPQSEMEIQDAEDSMQERGNLRLAAIIGALAVSYSAIHRYKDTQILRCDN